MTEIYFVVPGKVVPKQSTRFYRGHCVPQKKVEDYAKHVKACFYEEYPIQRMVWEDKDTPLEIIINVYFEVPKSESKKKREAKLLFGFPTKIPDLDNCTKSVMDACKKVIFPDDAQIVSQTARKFWASEPSVEVTIREAKR